MPSYGSPSPSPPQFGRGQASHKDPAQLLRALLRKAFLDLEGPLAEWGEASDEGVQVLRALVNASDRLRDFSAAEGQLGVLSRVPGAEDALRTRLIRSLERLYRVLQTPMANLTTACEKLEKIVDSAMQQWMEVQGQCDPEVLWESAYRGQPSIGEMQEWLQDCSCSLQRELALRRQFMCDVGSDEGLACAVGLWEARIWFDAEATRARMDSVRIHGT